MHVYVRSKYCRVWPWKARYSYSCAAGLRSQRTRERRAEWRVGGPRARESCFGFGVLHAVEQSVSVQRHCGVGSCTAVALLV
jgi:hypothetical protein